MMGRGLETASRVPQTIEYPVSVIGKFQFFGST
jgi:hypothetical protein